MSGNYAEFRVGDHHLGGCSQPQQPVLVLVHRFFLCKRNFTQMVSNPRLFISRLFIGSLLSKNWVQKHPGYRPSIQSMPPAYPFLPECGFVDATWNDHPLGFIFANLHASAQTGQIISGCEGRLRKRAPLQHLSFHCVTVAWSDTAERATRGAFLLPRTLNSQKMRQHTGPRQSDLTRETGINVFPQLLKEKIPADGRGPRDKES